jgi:thiamine-phosphate diphosphorylase
MLVTDRRQFSPDARTAGEEIAELEACLETAIAAGIDIVQIRERGLDAGALLGLVRRVTARARDTATRILVNDRADVALAAGASGVHLRSDGPAVARVRALGPAGWIVGRSVHGATEARAHAGADVLVAGTVFASGSKAPGSPTLGIDGLSAVVDDVPIPVIAIGGITPDRAGACVAAGAAGVAAIAAFLPDGRTPGSLGVARAVEAFRAAMAVRPR